MDEQAFALLIEPHPTGTPPPLLPDARLALRRGRRAPGDHAPRLEGIGPLRALRSVQHLAAHDRHQRLPDRDRTETRPAGGGLRRSRAPAAVSGWFAR